MFGDKSTCGQDNFPRNAAKEISPKYGETVYNVKSLGLNVTWGGASDVDCRS